MPWGRGPAGRSRARHLGVLFGLTAGLTLAGTRVGRAGEARLTVAAELAPASELTLAVASDGKASPNPTTIAVSRSAPSETGQRKTAIGGSRRKP